MVPPTVTLLVVTALMTIGGGGYQCQRSPISLIREPAAETGGEYFFDEGAYCNSGARERVAISSAVSMVGLLLTVGVALAPRLGMRPGRPIQPRLSVPPLDD